MGGIHHPLSLAGSIRSGGSLEPISPEAARARFMLPAEHENAFLSAKVVRQTSQNIDAVVADLNNTLKRIFASEALKQLLGSEEKTPSLKVIDDLPKNFEHFAAIDNPSNNIYLLRIPKGRKEHVMATGLFFTADIIFKEATRAFQAVDHSNPILAGYSLSSADAPSQNLHLSLFKQPEMLAFIKRHLRTFDLSILEPGDRQQGHKLKISASDSTGHCYTETFPIGGAISLKKTFQTLQELGLLSQQNITHHQKTLSIAMPHTPPGRATKIIHFNFSMPDKISEACDFVRRKLANAPAQIKNTEGLQALQTPQLSQFGISANFFKAYAKRKSSKVSGATSKSATKSPPQLRRH